MSETVKEIGEITPSAAGIYYFSLFCITAIIIAVDTTKLRANCSIFLQGLNHLLWPAVCINCREGIGESDGQLCKDCWQQILACSGGDYCRRCGCDGSGFAVVAGVCPLCQGKGFYFDRIARAGIYADALQRMILEFKNGKTELDAILTFMAESALQGSGFSDEIDMLVPVPLHFSKRLTRGYNQAMIIAKKLKNAHVKINTDLVRVRRTKPQPVMTTPAARARNVAGAFAVRKGHKFTGRKICLVDDIKTSGATLNECAKVLKQAGADTVFAVVLAVAGQNTG